MIIYTPTNANSLFERLVVALTNAKLLACWN